MIWIAPKSIERQLGSKWPVGRERLRRLSRFLPRPLVNPLRPGIRKAEPFAIPTRFFGAATPVEDTQRYALLADLQAHRDDPRGSLWYAQMMDALSREGRARYKTTAFHSEDEILGFLGGTMPDLFESIRTRGFDAAETGFESSAVIGPGGRLVKTGSGNHRFCIARLIELDRFPVTIVGADEGWLAETFPGGYDAQAVLAALPAIAEVHSGPGRWSGNLSMSGRA